MWILGWVGFCSEKNIPSCISIPSSRAYFCQKSAHGFLSAELVISEDAVWHHGSFSRVPLCGWGGVCGTGIPAGRQLSH